MELGFFSCLDGKSHSLIYSLYFIYKMSFSLDKVLTMCSEQIPYNDKLILFTWVFPGFAIPVNLDKALV